MEQNQTYALFLCATISRNCVLNRWTISSNPLPVHLSKDTILKRIIAAADIACIASVAIELRPCQRFRPVRLELLSIPPQPTLCTAIALYASSNPSTESSPDLSTVSHQLPFQNCEGSVVQEPKSAPCFHFAWDVGRTVKVLRNEPTRCHVLT